MKRKFICLLLSNNNSFLDGKKVENAHQLWEYWQIFHNNFKLPYKKMVSLMAARMFTLL